MTRVGVVDLGTNSTRLLIADVEDGDVREVDRRLTITRLGEGVDARGLLLPTALARVRNVLSDYRRAIEAHGAERTLAFGTSAVRDAENGDAFLGEIEWSYGFATRLLSGHDEALLTFRGVGVGRPLRAQTLIVDVGGGSTELILGGREGVVFHDSLDLGCVRLTERFLHGDPPTDEQVETAATFVRRLLVERAAADLRPSDAIGVAGTVTTLAMRSLGLDQERPGLVHGHRMSAEWVAVEFERLATMPVARIREQRGIHADRAPVIVAGALVVREVLAHFELDELEASERDIMHGVALETAGMPEPVEGNAPPGAYSCC